MASYSMQWSIKPVLHCLKRWLPMLRHIFLRSSCSSQREVGSIFLFRKLSLSCDLLWPTESRGRDVKWLLEALWLPFSALLGYNFHVQNPELDHWILRGCEKRKRETQPTIAITAEAPDMCLRIVDPLGPVEWCQPASHGTETNLPQRLLPNWRTLRNNQWWCFQSMKFWVVC